MKLKRITINNFRSYYKENIFEISDGLTLVIGDNGDGKTTFFEALEWLFNTSIDNKSTNNISEMRKSEMLVGDCDEVFVSILFEHDGEKEICKRFLFEKTDSGSIITRDFSCKGYFIDGAGRELIDGKILLERCFAAEIRKYCLFKGESELNVFDDNTALRKLVETFSGFKQYEHLVELTEGFERQSEILYMREIKKDKQQSDKIKSLENDLIQVNRQIQDVDIDIRQKTQIITDFEQKLKILENNQDLCENYQRIKARISSKKDALLKEKNNTKIDYNTILLDDMWILMAFAPILKQFKEKANKFSQEKRKLQIEDTERRAKEKGKQEIIHDLQKLANGATPLPWNLPDQQTMEEMIKDEVCKVCGTPAPKGSVPYNNMVRKLNEYLLHLQEEAEAKMKEQREEQPLFTNTHIEEIRNRAAQRDDEQEVNSKYSEVLNRIEYINFRKGLLAKIEDELQQAEAERDQLMMQSGGNFTEDMLDKNFSDYTGLSRSTNAAQLALKDLTQKKEQLEQKKEQLKEERDKIEPSNVSAQLYQKAHTVLDRVMKAFKNAKEKNINDFLAMLEKEANKYFEKLNMDDFRGIIRLVPRADGSARIELCSSNDTLITNPGGAQRTTMYMSVLFAISNITTLKREEDYPLIFDAPTSSFGDFKENVFYNIIDSIDKQCIIFTKDLLLFDRITGDKKLDHEKISQLSCSVYRIQKAPGFNQQDLSTIRTLTNLIKQ